MTKFAHDDVVPYAGSEANKKSQVAEMFNNISGRYDFMNRFLSAGIDKSWRKKALKELRELQPKKILDVATGTADVAIMAHKILHPEKIIGIDISEGMLAHGRKKIEQLKLQHVIELQTGDSETIKQPDNSFDAVTVAFGVRNFENLSTGLNEMHRVLKPGGRLVVLEFSRPKEKSFKAFYNFYMKIVAPKAGRMFTGNEEAYSYLCNSVQAFPEREQFLDIMRQSGFSNVYYKPLSLGICCIYCGSK